MNNYILKLLILIILIITVLKVTVVPLVKELLYLRRIRRKGRLTSGIVIGINEKEDLDRYKQYAKIIQFKTESNEKIVFESQEYTFRKPKIGEGISVFYDKEHPHAAIENFYKTIFFKFFLIVLISIILSLIIIVFIRENA